MRWLHAWVPRRHATGKQSQRAGRPHAGRRELEANPCLGEGLQHADADARLLDAHKVVHTGLQEGRQTGVGRQCSFVSVLPGGAS